jgi:hypothetical protein
MKSITELMVSIRECVNDTIVKNHLIQNTGKWHQICSCMDSIEDTELAVESYIKNYEPKDEGEKYLLLYGLLQTMIVQQDAAKHLSNSFGLDFSFSPEIRLIRDIRNESIGHPTKKGIRKEPISYHFISKISIHKFEFDLLSTFGDSRESIHKTIHLDSQLETQSKEIQASLLYVIKTMKEMKREIQMKFSGSKLQEVANMEKISHPLGYIQEAAYDPESWKGTYGVKEISKILEEFEKGLEERQLLEVENEDNIAVIKHALIKLERFFSGDKSVEIYDARIFAHFLNQKVGVDLIEQVSEIDNMYRFE